MTQVDDDRQLDPDNPWPGLDSFEESEQSFFHGRGHETAALLRRVVDSQVTVLFGRSGLGKTSLLRAGLFPLLRERHFLPVYLRFEVRPDAPGLLQQMRQVVCSTIQADVADATPALDGESLWEYLHRTDVEFWSAQNYPITPVIVLDQFEEVFTLGERIPALVESFRNDFGDLVENRIPADLAERGRTADAAAVPLHTRSQNYKVVVCLREDYLPELEEWCPLLPALRRSRSRLLRMGVEDALDAVAKPAGHMMTAELARRVVGIIAGEDLHNRGPGADGDGTAEVSSEVEPALLSLFCQGLNDERKRLGLDAFDENTVEGARRNILSNYYSSCVDALPARVARFVESELITEKGYRNSFARDDAVPSLITDDELSHLIRTRLLRLEERYGTQRIELTHDVLTPVVREHRDRRRAEEEKAALAARAEQERRAIEQAARLREADLDQRRQAERERRLESEARASRRLRWLTVALAILSSVSLVLAVTATRTARLAESRLVVIQAATQIKKALAEGDQRQIDAYAHRLPATVGFTVTTKDQSYQSGPARREVYLVTLKPVMSTLPSAGGGVVAVTYGFYRQSLLDNVVVVGSDRAFGASYNGYGCLTDVPVLVEYSDSGQAPELTQINVCSLLAGRPPGPYT